MYSIKQMNEEIDNIKNNIIAELKRRVELTPDKEINIKHLVLYRDNNEYNPTHIQKLKPTAIEFICYMGQERITKEMRYTTFSLDELKEILEYLEVQDK